MHSLPVHGSLSPQEAARHARQDLWVPGLARPCLLTPVATPQHHPPPCRQFMVGGSLLVSPVLQQGATSVDAHFPPGTWHSLWGSADVIQVGSVGAGHCAAAALRRLLARAAAVRPLAAALLLEAI